MLGLLRRTADFSIRAAAVVVLLMLLATVVLGVAWRAVGDPLIWSDELARYLMVWLALLGWILASRRRSHIRITLVIDQLPAWARRIAETVMQGGLLVLGVLLVSDGFVLVGRNLDVESVSLPVSSAFLYVPIVLAGFATAIQAVTQIVELYLRNPQQAVPAVSGGKPL
jgi:TRAP-type C4-dicarboxylate transport system permease small subunit